MLDNFPIEPEKGEAFTEEAIVKIFKSVEGLEKHEQMKQRQEAIELQKLCDEYNQLVATILQHLVLLDYYDFFVKSPSIQEALQNGVRLDSVIAALQGHEKNPAEFTLERIQKTLSDGVDCIPAIEISIKEKLFPSNRIEEYRAFYGKRRQCIEPLVKKGSAIISDFVTKEDLNILESVEQQKNMDQTIFSLFKLCNADLNLAVLDRLLSEQKK